ncbi:hypothetical protein RBH29_16520 [Herbivorax sp. ANBcel31]|uniref:hypothetical protein n=1 Tax=Herbivorax sp. ANBcel31 TaxID=3069754 RepID=UPI0027B4B032|nr:hypothetical protein [Herbivorax sp. ANBcel31]MDQ2088033.1 hypothetical protein [Herbivorax sp. ANBcel31]
MSQDIYKLTFRLTIAYAAFVASTQNRVEPSSFHEGLKKLLIGYESMEFLKLIEDVVNSIYNKENSKEYVLRIGLEKGISGYISYCSCSYSCMAQL